LYFYRLFQDLGKMSRREMLKSTEKKKKDFTKEFFMICNKR